MESRNSVNVYGCGGFGVKMTNLLRKAPINGADFNPYYVDTSRADLEPGQDMSKVYLIPGTDGSGKNPQINFAAIQKYTPNVLEKFAPSAINIISASLSGGSGNVIAINLAEAIWAQGGDVIFFMIASREDLNATSNTRNMLASLQNKARAAGKVAVVYFDDNQVATQNNDVDQDLVTSMGAFLDLYSGNHLRLDSKDVLHWLNPKVPPQILLLDVTTSYTRAAETEMLVSIATLFDSEDVRTAPIPSAYSCEGIRKIPQQNSIYLTISGGGLDRIVDSLSATITDYKQRMSNLEASSYKGLDKLKSTDGGMVFDD